MGTIPVAAKPGRYCSLSIPLPQPAHGVVVCRACRGFTHTRAPNKGHNTMDRQQCSPHTRNRQRTGGKIAGVSALRDDDRVAGALRVSQLPDASQLPFWLASWFLLVCWSRTEDMGEQRGDSPGSITGKGAAVLYWVCTAAVFHGAVPVNNTATPG